MGAGVLEQYDYVAPEPPEPPLSAECKKLDLELVHEAIFEVDPVAAERVWKCLTYMGRMHDHSAAERNWLYDHTKALQVASYAFALLLMHVICFASAL